MTTITTKITPGRRLPDSLNGNLPKMAPGDYIYDQLWGRWHGVTPNGLMFYFNDAHKIFTEDDGSITVSPSIGVNHDWEGKDRVWHGYLKKGFWETV